MSTPSGLSASAFTMALCPLRLWRNSPLGQRHCLMLSVEALANVYCVGCSTSARTLFLWFVSVTRVLPARRS